MEKGIVAEWLKKDGDFIQVGESLLSVEAEKATLAVEAFESGILRIPASSPPPGTEVPVGTILGYLVQPGEPIPAGPRPVTEAPAAMPAPTASGPAAPSPQSAAGSEPPRDVDPRVSPRARRVATELGVDWTAVKGSGRGGRIEERDVRRVAAASGGSV
jgi:pyruvate dehydrogenase E2 component (dihydrolipoamide acetyltransferase)